MIQELEEATWFEKNYREASVEAIKDYYKNLGFLTNLPVQVFNLCRVEFRKFYNFYYNDAVHCVALFNSNEAICMIHHQNPFVTRIIYGEHAGYLLMSVDLIMNKKCGIKDFPKLVELADFINYDFWLMGRYLNRQ